MQRSVSIVSALVLGLGASRAANARPMDPALSRLVVDPGCASSPAPACLPDRAAYHKLISQWGFALAPQPLHAARTTGLAGFNVALLAALTGIDDTADYWRRGTEGEGELAAQAMPGNPDPSAYLQLYSLEIRKGFGFGIEAAASVGVMPDTSLVAWGAELRVAVLEGMRRGVWRFLPDTSLGVALRQATGLGELALGTLALDARFSKPLVSPSGFVLTPWLGYQWLGIAADSTQVDLTPGIDPLASCGFAGSNVPAGSPDALAGDALAGDSSAADSSAGDSSAVAASPFDGSPLCRTGNAADFANSVSFGEADVQRQRVLLGVSYRQELLELGAELITDLLRPDAAQPDGAVRRALRCDAAGANCRPTPRQWSLVLQVGTVF